MSRLSGHSLWSEGWPVERDKTSVNGWRPGRCRADVGSALCECGEISPELDSAAERKRWHRAHKDQIRSAQAGDAA